MSRVASSKATTEASYIAEEDEFKQECHFHWGLVKMTRAFGTVFARFLVNAFKVIDEEAE